MSPPSPTAVNSDTVKSTFIDEALKDGHAVNEIFGDYLDKAKTSWTRKAPSADEEENVKMVKKIRTILSVAHHNLRMLEQNLVDGIQKKFPHLDPGVTRAPVIPQLEKSPQTMKADRHEESRDMFEEEVSEVEDDEPLPHLNRSLNEANRRAREEVLNSSSDDEVIHLPDKSPQETPRKRLRTKKELNGLRQKMQSSDDEEYSGNKSSERNLFRNLNEKALGVDLDTNQQLKKKVRIDIKILKPVIRADLKRFDAVG